MGASLTLIIPTYNRSGALEILLNTLLSELSGLQDRVDVIVGDNASTDDTPRVTAAFQASCPNARILRHAANHGFEENFCLCVEQVRTRYFWIIGDDDLPKKGVVRKMTELLREQSPSLVYLESEWVPQITGVDQSPAIQKIRWESLDALEYSKAVHIWFTFISGVIVDWDQVKERLEGQPIRRFIGTKVVQLGWIFPLLKGNGKFIFVHDKCVLATKDNSGGYPVLTVFGANFSRIVNESFGRGALLSRALIGGALAHYLPGRVWEIRVAGVRTFDPEAPWDLLKQELKGYTLFWVLLLPLGRAPGVIAWPVYQIWRVASRLKRDALRVRNAWKL